MKRLIIFIVIILIVINIIDKYIYDYLHSKGEIINNVILPDIFHDNTLKIDKKIPDYFLIIFIIIFLIYFLFNREYQYILLLLLFYLLSKFICYLYFSVTILPDSSKSCIKSNNSWDSILNLGSCNCLNISGHFLNIIFIFLLLNLYFKNKYWYIFVLLYIIYFYLICSSRNHYTVDCLNSTVIAILIFSQKKYIVKFANYLIGKNYVKI